MHRLLPVQRQGDRPVRHSGVVDAVNHDRPGLVGVVDDSGKSPGLLAGVGDGQQERENVLAAPFAGRGGQIGQMPRGARKQAHHLEVAAGRGDRKPPMALTVPEAAAADVAAGSVVVGRAGFECLRAEPACCAGGQREPNLFVGGFPHVVTAGDPDVDVSVAGIDQTQMARG